MVKITIEDVRKKYGEIECPVTGKYINPVDRCFYVLGEDFKKGLGFLPVFP